MLEVLLWCSIVQAVTCNPYFIHQGEIYSEYSSWLVTYTINVEPFSQHVGHVCELLGQFRINSNHLFENTLLATNATNLKGESSQMMRLRNNMLLAIRREETCLKGQYIHVSDMIEAIKELTEASKSRPSRAALSFIGTQLSYLFGTATEGNLKQLRLALSSLRDSQAKTIHVVSESISLVNKTHSQVRENRDAINSLVNVTNMLADKVQFVHAENEKLRTVLGYVELNIQMRELFHIMSRAILGTRRSLSALLHQISETANGDLSLGMIKPSELASLLVNIEERLDGHMALPYPILGKSLLLYYRYPHPLIIPNGNSFHIVMALPLVDHESRFNVYKLISVPEPEDQSSMSVEYHVESDLIAVSSDKNQFALISDFERCSSEIMCKLKVPIYYVLNSPTCVIALYLKDEIRIKENCAKAYTEKSKNPIVKRLFQNNWLLSTSVPFDIVPTCQDKVTKVQIHQGVQIFKQEQGCHISSKYFVIATHLSQEGETSISAKPHFESEIEMSKFLFKPKQFLDLIPEPQTYNDSLKPAKYLDKIKALPVANLHALLQAAYQQAHSVNLGANYTSKTHFSISLGVLCAVIITIMMVSVIVLCKVWFTRVQTVSKQSNVEPAVVLT